MTALAVVLWSAWGLVLYTYILFPLLLALFARMWGDRRVSSPPPVDSEADSGWPRVAMVVAAFNEAGVLQAKLENSWSIDYPADRFELIVGSDGSDDGTNEILAQCKDPRLRSWLFAERRGKISVLNDLVERSDAEIVVMSDANTMFAPDALLRLMGGFRDPAVGCVSGELHLEQGGGVSGEGLYWKYEGWIKRNESRLGFLIGCNGGIFALRRSLYQPLPTSTIVEDFVLSMRILQGGYQIRFLPEARAVEPACASSRAEMVRKIRIGAGGFQALALTSALLHPRYGLRAFAYWGHKVLRWCVPFFLVTALAANIGLAAGPGYAAFLAAQAAGMLIATWAYRSGGTGQPRALRPIGYFYLMNFAILRGFVRFITGRQRVTWERAAPASSRTEPIHG